MSTSEEGLSLPLEALQGDWVASRGETIKVTGKQLTINGNTMQLKLASDGEHVIGYGIYELRRGSATMEVVWQAGFQEITWRRPAEGEVQSRSRFMRDQTSLQGQSRAAAANSGGFAWGIDSEREAVSRMNAIIQRWTEGPPRRVRSCDICPDWTNRSETGLSVDHVHYVASMIAAEGFKSRRRTKDGAHDVPVLIRERADSQLGRNTLEKWRQAIAERPAFPPFLLDGKAEFFCSLGNGHFSQALNLFRVQALNLWSDIPYLSGHDDALREALDDGVESVVLSPDMPMSDRRFVSEMLNKSHGRKWVVEDDGHVHIDDQGSAESSTQFEAWSKVLDSEELSCLVRQKLHIDSSGNAVDRANRLRALLKQQLNAPAAADKHKGSEDKRTSKLNVLSDTSIRPSRL